MKNRRSITTSRIAACAAALAGSLGAGCGDDANDFDGRFGVPIFGVTSNGDLVSFQSGFPGGGLLGSVAITGVNGAIVGIDFRPANGALYAVSSAGGIYTLDTLTGAATLSSTLSTPLQGTAFGVDFNPVADRLRIVSDTGQNLRVDVATGSATVDTSLAYAAGDPNAGVTPNVVAAAYTDNVAGATATTLYTIDSGTDTLNLQNPPNDGTQETVGRLGVDASNVVCFDFAGTEGPTFAAITDGGVSTLYYVDLASGHLNSFGVVEGASLIGCSALP